MRGGGPAERAGDVLLSAGRRELRSVADLYAAIDDAAGGGRLALRILRGTDEQRATVTLGVALDGAAASTAGRSRTGEHRL